jgi:hypothetical protein
MVYRHVDTKSVIQSPDIRYCSVAYRRLGQHNPSYRYSQYLTLFWQRGARRQPRPPSLQSSKTKNPIVDAPPIEWPLLIAEDITFSLSVCHVNLLSVDCIHPVSLSRENNDVSTMHGVQRFVDTGRCAPREAACPQVN